MKMRNARLAIAAVGLVLPYAARLLRGIQWLQQYTDTGLAGMLLLETCNAIAWGSMLAVSFLYRRPASLTALCLMGFGFLAWTHNTLDLRTNAQAAIALLFIPIYALLPIAIGGTIGYIMDRRLRRHDAA